MSWFLTFLLIGAAFAALLLIGLLCLSWGLMTLLSGLIVLTGVAVFALPLACLGAPLWFLCFEGWGAALLCLPFSAALAWAWHRYCREHGLYALARRASALDDAQRGGA